MACDGSTVLLMKLLVGLGHIITLAQICEDGKQTYWPIPWSRKVYLHVKLYI